MIIAATLPAQRFVVWISLVGRLVLHWRELLRSRKSRHLNGDARVAEIAAVMAAGGYRPQTALISHEHVLEREKKFYLLEEDDDL